MASTQHSHIARAAHERIGFWAVAATFTIAMAFTTVPTPLWSLYAQRDGLSSLIITVAFAVYALAVALSLFLGGLGLEHRGRRTIRPSSRPQPTST